MNKYILLLIILLTSVCTYGQAGKEKIIAAFDTVTFNADSAITGAYHLKKGLYDGYAIKYGVNNSIMVGKYKKGKPDGLWLHDDPRFFTFYKKGIQSDWMANWDFAGDRIRAEQNFWVLYWKAVNAGKTKK